jgi:hypothetical protein
MTVMSRVSILALVLVLWSTSGRAADRLCDSSFEDCRSHLLSLIRNETTGIDVAFWFMEDVRYATALIERFRAGVPVRLIIDTEANTSYPLNATHLSMLRDAGIPMIEKVTGGIVHWKMMLFAGQNVVEFSGANFSPHAFVAQDPYRDYLDEVIAFVDDPAIVNSFKTRFDDVWVATSGYAPYANVSGTRTRRYPLFPIDARMNFVPFENFARRSVRRYNAETNKIDAIMFRITDARHTDALIAAMARGVHFRLITDEQEYRDPSRLWHAYNVDRLYMAAAQFCPATCGVRLEAHRGSLHQKSTLLYGQGMTIFGSSNWTSPSASSQLEHNMFTTSPLYFQFFRDQFERKWNSSNPVGATETTPLVPQPPTPPVYVSPVNAVQEQGLAVTLRWHGGFWAHKYDIYLGTEPANLQLIAGDQLLGPSQSSRDYITFPVSGLQESTTYYWRIVSKTMANVPNAGPVWSFRTSGSATAAGPLTLTALTPSAPSPQRLGTTIRFTAAATGGVAPYQYKWWVFDGSSWGVARNWSTSRTFSWKPTRPGNGYMVGVWIRSAGSTIDLYENLGSQQTMPFAILRNRRVTQTSDFDGDRKSDYAVWRPSTGVWWVIRSSDHRVTTQHWGGVFGSFDDVPVPGDYDGDGRTDVAVWRKSTNVWWVLRSSDNGALTRPFGEAGDVPVPGDYDGDGRTDFAVWHPSSGVWEVMHSTTGSIVTRQWGFGHAPFNDVPVPADYDGDAVTDMAVWRASTGVWYIIRSRDGGVNQVQWGVDRDIPVPADYDGDRRVDLAVWRPSTGVWWVIRSSDGRVRTRQWGFGFAPYNDVPVPADYDGDSRADYAVWRSADGVWYVIPSSTGVGFTRQWGLSNDIPVAKPR